MQRTFQAMTRQFTFLSLALALTASLSACPSSVPLMPGQGQQQSSFGYLNGQTAVPDEYLIKRKGSAYLQDPMQFAQQYGLLFVREIEPLGVELFKVTSPAALEQVRAMAEYIEPNYLRYLSMPAQQAQALRAASVFQRQNAEADENELHVLTGQLHNVIQIQLNRSCRLGSCGLAAQLVAALLAEGCAFFVRSAAVYTKLCH